MNSLIIVTGCPGTGKSHWARLIAREFPALQSLSYDEVKERFWDAYGFCNREQKLALNERSLRAFYVELDERMARGVDILIEYPFNARHAPTLRDLIECHGYRAATVFLHGDMRVIYERSVARDRHDARHPGHLLAYYQRGEVAPLTHDASAEFLTFETFAASCLRKDYDIHLGENIPVDVTDFAAIDYGAVFAHIRRATALD